MWQKITTWFKSTGIELAIDALDYAVVPLATEIEKVKGKFNAMTSTDQAQWMVYQAKAFLRKKFGIV